MTEFTDSLRSSPHEPTIHSRLQGTVGTTVAQSEHSIPSGSDAEKAERQNVQVAGAWRFLPQLGLLALTALGSFVISARPSPWWGDERIARTVRDLPAYTLITASNTEGVDVFLSGEDDVKFTVALGQVLNIPSPRHTTLTEEMLIALPDTSREWRVIVAPLEDTVPPAVGETVVLFGLDVGKGSRLLGTPSTTNSSNSSNHNSKPAGAPMGTLIGTPVVPVPDQQIIATEAFVLGTTDDEIVLAVTPDEADQALPYQFGDDRRLHVRKSFLPLPTSTPAPTATMTPTRTPRATRTPTSAPNWLPVSTP
jgi:hypothetical protein